MYQVQAMLWVRFIDIQVENIQWVLPNCIINSVIALNLIVNNITVLYIHAVTKITLPKHANKTTIGSLHGFLRNAFFVPQQQRKRYQYPYWNLMSIHKRVLDSNFYMNCPSHKKGI